jgi:signal transduction histidine kinase
MNQLWQTLKRYWPNRLWVQLSLVFSLTIFFSVPLVMLSVVYLDRGPTVGNLLLATLNTDDGPISFLKSFYRRDGSWDRAVTQLERLGRFTPAPSSAIFQLSLVDEGGRVIYSPDQEEVGSNLDALNTGNVLPLEIDGRIRGYLRVNFLSNTAFEATIQTFAVAQARNALLSGGVVGSVLGCLVGIVASRWLTRPLDALAASARAIRDGDRQHRPPLVGTSEMRQVAQAFNQMIDSVQANEDIRRNLVADVAHELRTPLSVLQGNLYALLEGVYPLEKAQIAQLYDQTRLLSRLVNDLHELSQAEARQLPLHRQPLDLGVVLEDVLETFRLMSAEKQIQLDAQLAPSLPLIDADAQRIQQVLHNLLSNALRHTPEGGRVLVTAETRDGRVCVGVADNGAGIAAEHLPHVFDRFYRADPSRDRAGGGAGLGLTISRLIAELHGGQLTVESDGVGRGSRFRLWLVAG